MITQQVRRCPKCNEILHNVRKTEFKEAHAKCYDCEYEESTHIEMND